MYQLTIPDYSTNTVLNDLAAIRENFAQIGNLLIEKAQNPIGALNGQLAFVNGEMVKYDSNGATWSPALTKLTITGQAGYPAIDCLSNDSFAIRGSSISATGVGGYSLLAYGVFGYSDSGTGVVGNAGLYYGVMGTSISNNGIYGSSVSSHSIKAEKTTLGGYALYASSTNTTAIVGESISSNAITGNAVTGDGVYGYTTTGNGVYGYSYINFGVKGISNTGYGIYGSSISSHSIYADKTTAGGYAIYASSTQTTALYSISISANGVAGYSTQAYGVFGYSLNGTGVAGNSEIYYGVMGTSTSNYGIYGCSTNNFGGGFDNGIKVTSTGKISELPQSISYTTLSNMSNGDVIGDGIIAVTAVSIAKYEALYLTSSGYNKAKADSSTTMPTIAIAAESGSGNIKLLKRGTMMNTSWSFTKGDLIFLSSSTAGAITSSKPSTTGQQVQLLGIAEASNIVRFNVDTPVWIEI